MPDNQLPPGLVLWPDDGAASQRIAVLISDIHCTDCTVGNQTADETDWEMFFRELEKSLENTIIGSSEVMLILNGDVADVLRSGEWVEADVYPWQRDKPGYNEIVMRIMRMIAQRHALDPDVNSHSSGFFFYLQAMVARLKTKRVRVNLISIAGNHDKILQVVPEAREFYYRECLGLAADDFSTGYRDWVARQMGSDPAEVWPLLPFYFADPQLRLFATHGQWRDSSNSGTTRLWQSGKGWQPLLWQQEQYRAFSDNCYGDTIATGLLSNFIWNTSRAIERAVKPDVHRSHILNVLREMDLYRPAVSAVVRLLNEAKKLDRSDLNSRLLYQTVVDEYRNSLQSWLSHPETFSTAAPVMKIVLCCIRWLRHLHWDRVDTGMLQAMIWFSGLEDKTRFAELPAFLDAYRPLGFRLHVEGHTHVAMEEDLHFSPPQEHRNYTYVNLGAWRNRIVRKFDLQGYRRRSIGRALIVQSNAVPDPAGSRYGFTLRDITSWGDDLDKW